MKLFSVSVIATGETLFNVAAADFATVQAWLPADHSGTVETEETHFSLAEAIAEGYTVYELPAQAGAASERLKRDVKPDVTRLVEALRGLMNYVGGWDAPEDHPCGIAAAVLAKYESGTNS